MTSSSALLPETVAIPEAACGERLDKVLTALFPSYSRTRITQCIASAGVQIDGKMILKASYRLRAQDKELIFWGQHPQREAHWGPEVGEISVLFEDDHFLVVNKAADVVVHPSPGTPSGSLINFLQHAYPKLSALPRAGLVHRLDKGTSGLLLVAKTEPMLEALSQALKERSIHREYCALVWGHPNAFGMIDKPIGRHPKFRKKMAILSKSGRPAQTRFYKIAQFKELAYLRVVLTTGRTHQIRVHLSNAGYPLLGDPLYRGASICPMAHSETLEWQFPALHAKKLSFIHPISGSMQNFHAPLPKKFVETLRGCERQSFVADSVE